MKQKNCLRHAPYHCFICLCVQAAALTTGQRQLRGLKLSSATWAGICLTLTCLVYLSLQVSNSHHHPLFCRAPLTAHDLRILETYVYCNDITHY